MDVPSHKLKRRGQKIRKWREQDGGPWPSSSPPPLTHSWMFLWIFLEWFSACCEFYGRCIDRREDVDDFIYWASCLVAEVCLKLFADLLHQYFRPWLFLWVMHFLLTLLFVYLWVGSWCECEVGPDSINKDLSDEIWIPDKRSQNSQVFSISHNADVTVLSCETLTPFILPAFLLITALPWEPAG